MQRPVAALAGPVGTTRDLDEAVVEGEIVPQRVLPTLRVVAVVGKAVDDELVDVVEGHHLVGRRLDGHRRQGDVRVGWLLVAVRVTTRAGHDGYTGTPLTASD